VPAVCAAKPRALGGVSRIVAATVALAALALVGAGCGTPGSGIQAGERVTVYVSMPLRGREGLDGRDVVRGAKLALADAGGRVGKLAVRAIYLDDTAGQGGRAHWSQAVAAANGRKATEDSTAIAYLGDFDAGATRASLPITNEARMLQVSPASAAVDLVQPFLGAGDEVPKDLQTTGERTFGRVIPSDPVQAEAAAAWAKRLGVKRVTAISGGSQFGDTMVTAFRQAASSLAHTGSRRADLLYYGGLALDAPTALAHRPSGPVMGSDALLPPFSAAAGVVASLATSAAQDPSQLPAAGRRFLRAYRSRHARQPGRYAAYGYEAMAVVLDSIERAGDQGDIRDSVVDAFFDTQDRDSILGRYSIDEVGDTTLDRLAGYRLRNGRPVFATPLSGR
jgi:branched-chain amino acid transport system substrate-binding protein